VDPSPGPLGPPLGHPPLGRPPGPPPFGIPPFAGPAPEGFEVPAADVSGIARKWLDVAYAHTSAAQRLDIYLPETGDGPFPVLLGIHGGAFAIGDKRDANHLRPFLCGLYRGYGAVSINYRLSGEAIFPAGLQDVRAAIRWLRANGREYSLDPGRIVAWGGSSGANYAAMAAVAAAHPIFDDSALGNGGFPCDVQLAVDWFGPTDFLTMDEQLAKNGLGPTDHNEPFSPESRYLGRPISDVPDKVRLASPITYVGPCMAPILIQHGRADNLVPFQQSVQLSEAIEARVGTDRFALDLFDGAVHDDPHFTSDENLDRVFDFIERRLA
jgi:acetyl esterase/lipase